MKLAGCLLIASVVWLVVRPTQAQHTAIKIQAFNGKTGAPLTKQRLLIFAGATQQDVEFHRKNFDLTTDASGEATLLFDQANVQWIQIFADYLTLCQSKPNYQSFSVSQIISSGLSSPNKCGKLTRPNKAGRFIVFARPATLAEKMRR